MTPTHWMARVARKANFPLAQSFQLSPTATVVEAWDEVSAQCGVSQEAVAQAVADFFHLPVADFEDVQPTAVKLLPGSVAQRFGVFPLRDHIIHIAVATANPPDLEAEKEIGFASGRVPELHVAPPAALMEAIGAAYSPENAAENLLNRMDTDVGNLVELVEDEPVHPEVSAEELDAGGPVVRLTNMILQEAVTQGASDIHIQPLPGGGTVRYRVDGVLRTGLKLPLAVLVRVVSRIKIMSRLDITDHLRPQDGRARILVKGHKYDLRVSTVPTRNAEKAVIRILDPFQTGGLADTGVSSHEVSRMRDMLRHRDGIVVVTGPTGSGKTTTMYAALREVATEDVNIMTVEDPVEYELSGLTQIQVEPKQGVTFASALRAILRQDPDVIFVGEIRDLETAQIAAQASLTGHLVLATVHANDAVGAVRRFLDLGLDPGTIGETLRGMLAQRLVRTVCTSCAEPWAQRTADDDVEEDLIRKFRVEPAVRAVGCKACGQTGYSGRMPVVELIRATADLRDLLDRGATHLEMVQQARRDGMRTMTEGALDLVREGRTTLTEVERVIGKENVSLLTEKVQPAVDTPSAGEAPTPEEAPAPAPAEPAAAPPPTPVAPPAAPPPITSTAPAPVTPPEAETAPNPDRIQLDLLFHPADPKPGSQNELLHGYQDAYAGTESAHILVVDDDADVRLFARSVLEKRGYRVTEAADGGEALVALAKQPDLDLMLLDLAMPKLDGREVLKATRTSIATANLPVVVLTAMEEPDLEVKVLEEGADDYLHKPMDPMLLLGRIKAALRRARG